MWKPYAKALTGSLLAAIFVATPLVDDGLTVSEWLGIIAAGLGTFAGVWVTPWMPKAPR